MQNSPTQPYTVSELSVKRHGRGRPTERGEGPRGRDITAARPPGFTWKKYHFFLLFMFASSSFSETALIKLWLRLPTLSFPDSPMHHEPPQKDRREHG